MNENEIGALIVKTAVHVHMNLGPGLFESVYEAILMRSLSKKGLFVQRQVPIPYKFWGSVNERWYRQNY